MALAATKKSEHNLGGLKHQVWNIDLASVTDGTFDTGLSDIHSAVFNNETTEADGRLLKNKSAASTAASGHIFMDGFTSGDDVTVVVVGV